MCCHSGAIDAAALVLITRFHESRSNATLSETVVGEEHRARLPRCAASLQHASDFALPWRAEAAG